MNKELLNKFHKELKELAKLAWQNPGFQWLGMALDEVIKRVEIVLGSDV